MCHVILPQPVVCHLPKGDASPHRISRHYNLLDHRTLGLSLLPDESGACANTQKIRLQCTSKTPEISLVYPPGYYPIADFGEGSLVQVSPATEMSLPGTCVLSDQSVATFSAGNVTSDEVTIGCANAECIDDCVVPTVVNEPCPSGDVDVFGFRIRRCNSGGEVFLGIGSGVNPRSELNPCGAGEFFTGTIDFTFTYDPSITTNELDISVTYTDTNYQTSYNLDDSFCPNGINSVQFFYRDNDVVQTVLNTENIQLDGMPLTDLNIMTANDAMNQQNFCISRGIGFDDGFTFTGTLDVENFNGNPSEGVKIELLAICNPSS
jgi:hypothetical protein